jgi:hypothetical protein
LSDVAVVERRGPTNSRRHKAPIITAGSAPRPSKTRFGDFEFKGGYPTAASSTALLDQLKVNRAIEVYFAQIPAVTVRSTVTRLVIAAT